MSSVLSDWKEALLAIEVDLAFEGYLPECAGEYFDGEVYGEDVASGGYDTVELPPELFGMWERLFMQRVTELLRTMRLPKNEMEAAVLGVVADAADAGIRVSLEGLTLAMGLGLAKLQGVDIRTHPRDLAKEAGVRYQTLLRLRRLAIARFAAVHLAPLPSSDYDQGNWLCGAYRPGIYDEGE